MDDLPSGAAADGPGVPTVTTDKIELAAELYTALKDIPTYITYFQTQNTCYFDIDKADTI